MGDGRWGEPRRKLESSARTLCPQSTPRTFTNSSQPPQYSFTMMNWVKQQYVSKTISQKSLLTLPRLRSANLVGTAEPIYGPSAIQSVAKEAETTPYTELTKEGLKWKTLNTTSVETSTFYLMADTGHIGLAQIIYSNVAYASLGPFKSIADISRGIRTTVQFNTKIFYPKGADGKATKPNLWSSDALSGVDISDDKFNFYADNVAIELSEDGTTYTIKSMTNQNSLVNLTFKRTAPGFTVGKDGTSYFGTDPAAPWGTIRHAFWPRNVVEGSIVTPDGPVDFKGKGLYSFAIQGMKPHHAAGKWDFINFQSPTYSAIMMKFTTPPSYGSTVVTVGGIAKDGEIVYAGSGTTVTHTKVNTDPETEWPEPEAIKYEYSGKNKDGKDVSAVIEGPLDTRVDRVDIMAEVPGFVKSIISAAAGTKPYIYQVSFLAIR